MIKKCSFIFLLPFFVNFFSFVYGQKVNLKISKLENIPFISNGVRSNILNTFSFKKPDILNERVLLLINDQLYTEAKKEIDQFIQDLFDEGIDARPFLLSHTQFLNFQNRWHAEAGIKLKKFIKDAYDHQRIQEIPSREKRGLIILGAFPAMFINWHQEDLKPAPPSWANLQASNDYLNAVIQLSWSPPLGGKGVDHYELRIYNVPVIYLKQAFEQVHWPG